MANKIINSRIQIIHLTLVFKGVISLVTGAVFLFQVILYKIAFVKKTLKNSFSLHIKVMKLEKNKGLHVINLKYIKMFLWLSH